MPEYTIAYLPKTSLYVTAPSKPYNLSEYTPDRIIGSGEYVSEKDGIRCSFEPYGDFAKQDHSDTYLSLARLLQKSISYPRPYFLHNMYELITNYRTSKDIYLIPKPSDEIMTFIDKEISIKLKAKIMKFNIPDGYTLDNIVSSFNPLQMSNDHPMPRKRADGALGGLRGIRHYYYKDRVGKEAFENIDEPPDDTMHRIQNPKLAGLEADPHCIIDEIEKMIIEFKKTYDLDLTYFAMSPNTAAYLAENAQENNLLHGEIAEYRVMGDVKKFPGIEYVKAIISVPCPDDVIYAIVKDRGPMRLYDGAKMLTAQISDSGDVTQIVNIDYHQYKCVHEDLKDHVFGCTIKFKT